jgi:ubiquinone/menaquinone biosynthesis C-methylase UbiE
MLTVDFDRLAVRKGDAALDAGCGFGRHSMEFMKRGASVYSMDLDLESVRKTRFILAEMKRQEKSHADAKYLSLNGNAMGMPFKDGSFDRIICSEVMEHVSDDKKACSELFRVLKPGGRIAITVPTYFSELVYDSLTFEYFSTPGGHIRKYTPVQLAQIMKDCGFEIYAIDFKHAFHTIWWMIRCVVGLHLENHPMTKSYHKFLHMGLMSKFMRRTELFFNFFFAKSVIIYGWKR